MPQTIRELSLRIRDHRCYQHPIFEHWAEMAPRPAVLGALFHQIQKFCSATRPGGAFPDALRAHGMAAEGGLLDEIVESEEDHGPELATMAAHIINRALDVPIFLDVEDQTGIEAWLKDRSDELLGQLPGYSAQEGLTAQARRAIRLFDRRQACDRETTLLNLGTALALEIVSNRQLIPGEKLALIDSGLYSASLKEPEMHYLLEHYGELGAEQSHERNAIAAVESVLDESTEELLFAGAMEFLDALGALWDVLDASLLQSGVPAEVAIA